MATNVRVKLTERMVQTLKPVERETWIMDSEITGLGVRLRPKAKSVYAIRWKDERGRDRKLTIGSISIPLAGARTTARLKLGDIAAGKNPLDKGEEYHKQTVADLVDRVADDMATAGRSETYIRDFKQQCRDYVVPHLGTMRVYEVKCDSVDRVLWRLRKTPALHNRVRAVLSRMFKLAIRWGYRSDDPTFGAERQQEQPRERGLTDAELTAILGALADMPPQVADAVRLLTWTGSRPQELFKATWAEFDLEEGVWTKPTQNVKQRRTHTVPLHPLAVATLKRMKDDARPNDLDTYVFPSPRGEGHLTTIKRSFYRVLEVAGITEDTRPYDLRKAFATRLMASGTDLKTVMSLTGHTQVAVLLKHYAQVVPDRQKEALTKVFG